MVDFITARLRQRAAGSVICPAVMQFFRSSPSSAAHFAHHRRRAAGHSLAQRALPEACLLCLLPAQMRQRCALLISPVAPSLVDRSAFHQLS